MKLKAVGAAVVVLVLLATGMGAADAAGPVGAHVDNIVFDTATHRFSLSWQLDTSDIPSDCQGAFVFFCGSAASLPAQPDDYFPVVTSKGDTAVTVESLRFDTTYRVGMWLQIQGVWYAPDSASLRSVTVPKAAWEPVRLFNVPLGDTIEVLGKEVLFWHDASFGGSSPAHPDTVRDYEIPASQLKGFRQVAMGFKFADPVSLPPFFIGFRLDSLFKKASACAIYRDSGGHLLAEFETVRDTLRNLLYVKAFRTDLPFVVLADTGRPSVEFNVDTGHVIGADSLRMAFTVRDNSSSCSWRLFYRGAGDRPFSTAVTAQFSGMLHDTTAEISCRIPVAGAGEAGLRVYLTIDDGVWADTINVSHQASRSRCNETTTPANIIVPLAPGAVLSRPGCTDVLRSLFEHAGGTYAIDQFRLYAWRPAAAGGSGWMEYAPGNKTEFEFLPGTLYWLITKDARLLDLGDGRSTSLKDTLTIELPPRIWTDFSSPFSFPVAFKDILAASGDGAARLSIYRWTKEPAKRTWRAEALYNGAVSGLDAPSILLSYGTNGYFTAYNPSDTTIRLRIPPVPPAEKAGKISSLPRGGTGWTVRFDLEQSGTTIGSVVCAASPLVEAAYAIPPPPSFSGSGPAITLSRQGAGEASGMVIYPLRDNGEQTCELSIGSTISSLAGDVDIVPHLVAGAVSGCMVVENNLYAFPGRIPLARGDHEFRKIIFRAGAIIEGGRISAPVVAASRPVIATAVNGRGAVLWISSQAPVNRIELFDLAGRKTGDGHYGTLHGKIVVAGVTRSRGAGVAVVRLTSGDGRRMAERQLGNVVLVR